ncbi:MAG: hypothetical protein JW749_11465 [Sedimentisphaerales bacterium]|nr:hypothetical protein [Sedimentisphaerales bacterium]
MIPDGSKDVNNFKAFFPNAPEPLTIDLKTRPCNSIIASLNMLKMNKIAVFAAIASLLLSTPAQAQLLNLLFNKIDRHALVKRHNVILTDFNALTPLSVGNGRFTFTADLTGLQTFATHYEKGIPLSTMAEWGWHTFPNTGNYKLEDTFRQVDTDGRKVPYNIDRESSPALYLRANPHQTNLAQIGFVLLKKDGNQASVEEITKPRQQLNLWEGILKSSFQLENDKVEVETFCNPDVDMLVVKVKSKLLKTGRLGISLKFPCASAGWGPNPANWENTDGHTTEFITNKEKEGLLLRRMNDLEYHCILKYSRKTELTQASKHIFNIRPLGKGDSFQLCVLLSKGIVDLSSYEFEKLRRRCRHHWKKFWTTGGAIDLSQSKDPRWKELERRIVLSRYLTAIQCAQKYPPQETGLTVNSWFGKFHLEMHWWHSVHFALWGRPEILETQLTWYRQILPAAKEIAGRQGYDGARWPKMVAPDGRDAPSNIGPLLIWQQPHPIYYAELMYRQKPTRETLEQYREIVEQTAEFMASYARWNQTSKCFELGPPLISAREFQPEDFEQTKNPAFELAYWAWGLNKANQWRMRLGLEPQEKWEKIITHLAPLPESNGIYIEQQTPAVADGGHPAMLAAFGMLPDSPLVDKETMKKTLKYVMKNWEFESTWGWDYPLIAMTAARLGQPEIAIDALLMNVKKNTYLPNGHNYQDLELPVYLPGNGGLLTAVAMMAAGWDGAPDKPAPGFPDNARWKVKCEGLKKLP